MNLAAIRPILVATVLACSELPAGSVVWSDQPRPNIPYPNRALVRLKLLPSAMKGATDGSTWDVDSDKLVQTISSLRRVTMTVACDCLEQGDAFTAEGVLEKVRSRMYLQSSLDAMLAVGVSYQDSTQIAELPALNVDARVGSTAAFDAILSIEDTYTDAANPIDWIETADVEPA